MREEHVGGEEMEMKERQNRRKKVRKEKGEQRKMKGIRSRQEQAERGWN